MNTTTFNGIEIPHTPENIEKMKKIVKEFDGSDKIKNGDWYLYRNDKGIIVCTTWVSTDADKYRLENDNCLYGDNYNNDYATEYFNKRDARRAAETKLRKIIADMNKKDGYVANFDGVEENHYSDYCHDVEKYSVSSYNYYQSLPIWRYSSRATAEFVSENHADLLDIYLGYERI